MDAIKDWAMCMCAVAVVGAAVNMLASGSKYEKALRFAFALVAVVAIAAPLGDISECRGSYQTADDAYLSTYAGGLEERIADQTLSAVKNTVTAMATRELEALGVSNFDIVVAAELDDSGCVSVTGITVATDRTGYLLCGQIKDRLFARLGLEAEVLCKEE